MNLTDIVNDPRSTEQSFKFITPDYSLDLLFSDFEDDLYKRAVLVKLDNVPVMVATSETKAYNDLFVNLLKSSKNSPLGAKLFEPQSGIRQKNMTVTHQNSSEINDKFIYSYLNAFGFEYNVYVRESTFSCNKQTLQLKEYVLPGLKFIINKHSDSINKIPASNQIS